MTPLHPDIPLKANEIEEKGGTTVEGDEGRDATAQMVIVRNCSTGIEGGPFLFRTSPFPPYGGNLQVLHIMVK